MKKLLGIALAAALGCADLYWSTDFSKNYQQLLRRGNAAVHSLVSSDPNTMQRVVLALPALNSGAIMQFRPSVPTAGYQVKVHAGENNLTATYDSSSQTQLVTQLVDLSAETVLAQFVAGGVRTCRDFVEPATPVLHWDINYTRTITDSQAVIMRTFYNPSNSMEITFSGSIKIAELDFPADDACQGDGSCGKNGLMNLTITSASGVYPVVLNVTAKLIAPALTPVDAAQGLFDTSYDSKLPDDPNAKPFSFMAYNEKFVAGSWRFLTYFGRDTLITGFLMYDQLSATSIESILSGAIQRIDTTGTAYQDCSCLRPPCNCTSTGMVCHEETLGDYSGWQRTQSNQTAPDIDGMQCDYKMADTDLMILPLLARHVAYKGSSTFTMFMQKSVPSDFAINSDKTYSSLVVANVEHVLDMASRFVMTASFKDLVRIRHKTVGNWRDSDQGLGGGTFPFDVNVAWMPACLRAIQQLAQTNVISSSYAEKAGEYATFWEQNAHNYFYVNLVQSTYENRIEEYASAFGLLNALRRSDPADLPNNYYALALTDDSTKVEFLHTDVAFALLLRNDLDLPEDMCYFFAKSLTTKFPRGLDADVGPVVCNPSFAWGLPELQSYAAFLDNTQYHGTVIWQFQTVLAYEALTKWGAKDWISHSTQSAISHALTTLWTAMKAKTGVEMYSIVPNVTLGTFTDEDLSVVAGAGTESDVVQLWSYSNVGLKAPPASGAIQKVAQSSPVMLIGMIVLYLVM